MFRLLSLLFVLLLIEVPLPAQEQPTEESDKESLSDFVRRTAGRQAYGLYFGKQKIGWLIEEGGLGTHDGKEAGVFAFEGHFRMSLFGREMISKFDAKQAFSLEEPGRLIHARERSGDTEEELFLSPSEEHVPELLLRNMVTTFEAPATLDAGTRRVVSDPSGGTTSEGVGR